MASFLWPGTGVGSGTVTSIGLTVPSFLSVSPSSITTNGTFAITLNTETANTVFAGGASGSPATPTFRALVLADIPTLPYISTTLGTPLNGLSVSVNTLSLGLSSSGVTGALSGTDWNTFNGKQAAGNYITALTGDATASGPGSIALTLATVNSNTGPFGTASALPAITINAKGLITAATLTTIQIAESQVTNLVSDLAGKQVGPLTGDVTTSGAVATLAATSNGTIATLSKSSGVAVHGTNTNDAAASGFIGEFISANPGGVVTPAASGAYVNLASVSLTAGDWDVEGVVSFTPSTTTGTQVYGGISTTTGNQDSTNAGGFVQISVSLLNPFYLPTGARRISLSGTTTIFLVGGAVYTVLGTAKFSTDSFLRARRVR